MSIKGFFPCISTGTRTKHIIAFTILLFFFLLQAHIITLIATNDTSGSQPSMHLNDVGDKMNPLAKHDFERVSTKNSTLEADNNTLPNDRDRQDTQVKLAWLMSYPNSGTSYTMHLIQRASATTVATNYRQESYAHLQKGQPQPPVPVLTTSPGGPFVLSPEKPLPQTYIMTKTHCGSRCVNCSASKYVETKDSFLKQCSGGKDSSFGAYFYDPELVKRSIHLIRNPFDNVVSNFHLAAKRRAYSEYGNNMEGFRQWCADLDSKHAEEDRKSGLIPESIFDTFQDLPCHKVFYTFTQVSNRVFAH